jgi:pyruvate,water dikinase
VGGVACGPVHIVRSNIDLLQFPEGAVLVVAHPFPEWAFLLNRAVAVVSETGQVAAHLATVAREFQLPAIFGMEKATEVLKRGEMITVDAIGRRIYSGCEESILTQATPSPNLMKNSPVYRLLQEALTLITPLNLTDPASPFFKPSSCITFHDITRFCHEKAVIEMFQFGTRYRFDEKAAKQIVGKTPFQWWIIDLDGGFREGLDSKNKFIHIDDIVSTPMRAIWHGITAIPWQGPPPVSLKGFGAIIFQSTMNPESRACGTFLINCKKLFPCFKKLLQFKCPSGLSFCPCGNISERFFDRKLCQFSVQRRRRG